MASGSPSSSEDGSPRFLSLEMCFRSLCNPQVRNPQDVKDVIDGCRRWHHGWQNGKVDRFGATYRGWRIVCPDCLLRLLHCRCRYLPYANQHTTYSPFDIKRSAMETPYLHPVCGKHPHLDSIRLQDCGIPTREWWLSLGPRGIPIHLRRHSHALRDGLVQCCSPR